MGGAAQMAELGAGAGRRRRDRQQTINCNVSKLVAVGAGKLPGSNWAHITRVRGVRSRCTCPNAPAAVDLLHSELRPGDVVLVKASRWVGLERVAQALLDGGAEGEVAAR